MCKAADAVLSTLLLYMWCKNCAEGAKRNFAFGEYLCTLPLMSELNALCGADANRIPSRCGGGGSSHEEQTKSRAPTKKMGARLRRRSKAEFRLWRISMHLAAYERAQRALRCRCEPHSVAVRRRRFFARGTNEKQSPHKDGGSAFRW